MVQYKRANAAPLDITEVFTSLDSAEVYAASGATSYAGQVIAIAGEGVETKVYKITSGGTLVELVDAIALEKAGCFALVLEKIPAALAKRVSETIKIPTIGIGAGPHCDGQVLVMHDMLGLNNSFSPRFLRRYANLHEESLNAIRNYVADVKSCDFPNEKEQY
jgi:3-methyl-2-oxobutanoate hydroxymethyltransferase